MATLIPALVVHLKVISSPAGASQGMKADQAGLRRAIEHGLSPSASWSDHRVIELEVAELLSRLSDGVFLDVNDHWIELNGWTREEVVGKSSLALNIWRQGADRDAFVRKLFHRAVDDPLAYDLILNESGRTLDALVEIAAAVAEEKIARLRAREVAD